MSRLLLALVLLAGCASKSPSWEKDGATADDAAADLKLCEVSAPIAPRTPAGPRGRNPGASTMDFDAMARREGERFLKDQKHIGECMRAKGYAER